MPTLHVRSVPEDLYEALQRLAQARQRSLGGQVVTMLYEALETELRRTEQSETLEAIRRRRFRPPQGTPDSTHQLAEDRRR